VLQHDGHLFRMLLAQARGYLHARRPRIERDEEMMLAREPALGDIHEHLPHHPAQSLLGKDVVANAIVGHGGPGVWRDRIRP
jgi:hypothetical protein